MAFPPVPAPSLTDDLYAQLERAELALAQLDGAFGAHADAGAFESMQLRREALLSCRIESQPANFAAALGTGPDQDDGDAGAGAAPLQRCRQALETGLAASRRPLDVDFVVSVQAALAGAPPAAAGPNLATGLAEVDAFLTADNEVPELVRLGMAQSQFWRLLPPGYRDGRIERIAALAMFRRLRIPGAKALALSPYLHSRGSTYPSRLRGPLPEWLEFFIEGVAESAAQAADMIRRCAALASGHREAISASLGHAVGRGLQVFQRLTVEPVATVGDVKAITGTSYVAANLLVARFAEIGILEEITGYRRNRRFHYGPYVRVFDPDSKDAPERRIAPDLFATMPKPTRRPTAPKPRPKGPEPPAPKPKPAKPTPKPKPVKPKPPAPKPKRRPSPDFSDHLL